MIFAIYKEKEFTSRDVVNIIKKATGEKKTGHAGTLDPLAEGVLVIGVGKESTKKLHTNLFEEKEYIAVIKFGENSSTDDEEGEKKIIEVEEKPSYDKIKETVDLFCGEIKQVPPLFSAVKIKGREAYKWAREEVPVKLKEREVVIKKIDILNYNYPFLKIRVVSGKGVYIRSLARDIGSNLGAGGYLHSLIRTRVGEFDLEKTVHLKDFLNNLK